MWSCRDYNAGRNHRIKIDNSSFERVEQLKYLGTTLTSQNSTQEEIKSRTKAGSVCHHAVQNILSSSLLFKNVQIKIHRTKILPDVVHWCDTWSLTLREECRLRMSEYRVLRSIFGPKTDKVTRESRILHNEEPNDLYCSPNIVWVMK
jgi:hypothetical protein